MLELSPWCSYTGDSLYVGGMGGDYKEKTPFKKISHLQLSDTSNNSNKMCYINIPKYPITNGK